MEENMNAYSLDWLFNNVTIPALIVCVVLLQVAFIAMKLLHVIAWSWWWVCAPALVFIIFLIVLCWVVVKATGEGEGLV